MSCSYWAIRVFFYFRKWSQFVIFVAGWGSLVWHKKEAEKMQKWDKRESFGRVSKHTLSCFRKLEKKIYMTFHLTCPLPLKLREIFKSHSFSSFKIFKAFPSLSYATLTQNSNFCPKSRQKHRESQVTLLRAKRGYVYILSGQKFSKNLKNDEFWRGFEKVLTDRSISKIQMRHFEKFSNTVKNIHFL